jgi:hypothetical protein
MVGRPTPFAEDSLAPLVARVVIRSARVQRRVSGPCRPHIPMRFSMRRRATPLPSGSRGGFACSNAHPRLSGPKDETPLAIPINDRVLLGELHRIRPYNAHGPSIIGRVSRSIHPPTEISFCTFCLKSPQPTWEVLPERESVSSTMSRSISLAGNRRWPPSVERCGKRPSFAQRETVFGDTCSMRATSDVRRNFSPGCNMTIAAFGRVGPLVRPTFLNRVDYRSRAARVTWFGRGVLHGASALVDRDYPGLALAPDVSLRRPSVG